MQMTEKQNQRRHEHHNECIQKHKDINNIFYTKNQKHITTFQDEETFWRNKILICDHK